MKDNKIIWGNGGNFYHAVNLDCTAGYLECNNFCTLSNGTGLNYYEWRDMPRNMT